MYPSEPGRLTTSVNATTNGSIKGYHSFETAGRRLTFDSVGSPSTTETHRVRPFAPSFKDEQSFFAQSLSLSLSLFSPSLTLFDNVHQSLVLPFLSGRSVGQTRITTHARTWIFSAFPSACHLADPLARVS